MSDLSLAQSASGTTTAYSEGSTEYFAGSTSKTKVYNSYSQSGTYQAGITFTDSTEGESGLEERTQTASDGESFSTSYLTSGETTSEITAYGASSATSTYESVFYQTATGEAYYYPWTTSSQGGTSANSDAPVFFQAEEAATTTTIVQEYATRRGTETYTELLDQVVTLSGLPNTVVQADPGEILYLIRKMPQEWNGYSAATDVAESGARFTLSPKVSSFARISIAQTATTSSVQSPSFSTGVSYLVVTASQNTITVASYDSFPPRTETRTNNSFSLRSSSASLSISSQELIYGSGNTTINQTDYFTVPTTARRQTQNETYRGLTQTTHSLLVPRVIEAAVTLQSSTSGSTSYIVGISYVPAEQVEGSSFGSTIHAEGNTTVSVPRASLGSGGAFGRTKYCTTGAVIGSQTGGWITANASSQGFPFELYALDGAGRNGNTVFPDTNERQTVSSNSITWTTSTAALSGTGTQRTTTSAEFGISGTPTTIQDAAPLSIFRGYPGVGQTIVERPGQGVYKDQVGGSASTFSDGDVSITAGQSSVIKKWFPIRHIGPLSLGPNLNPVVWSEYRNSNSLPPNTPFA